MAYCDSCGNFDAIYDGILKNKKSPNYQPELYYYWDAPLEEDYDWRDEFPEADCLCEICLISQTKKARSNGGPNYNSL